MTKKKKAKRTGKPAAAQTPASQYALEKMLVDLNRLLEKQVIESEDDLTAFMQQITQSRKPIPPQPPRTPLEKAQDLMYKAWDAPTSEQLVRMARQALEISADCADAYNALAQEATSPEEVLQFLTEAVAAGERGLGADVFEHAAGHFWSMVETRPYMRACASLAQVLWGVERIPEAIAIYQDMLRLAPDDHQGNHRFLLICLLEGQANPGKGEIERLLAQYPDDESSLWLLTGALYQYRRLGRSFMSNQALRTVAETYPRVFYYLFGLAPLPHSHIEWMAVEKDKEEIDCIMRTGHLWLETPGAIQWAGDIVADGPSVGWISPRHRS